MTADLVVPRRRGAAPRAPWALMYHSVGDPSDDPHLVTVSPDRLARQLRWLSRHGMTGVSMRELLAARAQGRAAGLVGLTFDDGYADFLAEAVPLLRAHGHTATVFVLPGRLGGDNAWDPGGPRRPLLDAAGVRAALAAGMEIGSHGLLHRDLTAVDDATLEAETADSRQELAELTGTVPGGFCYPYGAVDARTRLAVRRAGYAYACAVDPGPLAGAHALPRTYVGERDNFARMHAKRVLHRMRGPLLPDPADHMPLDPRSPQGDGSAPGHQTPGHQTPGHQPPGHQPPGRRPQGRQAPLRRAQAAPPSAPPVPSSPSPNAVPDPAAPRPPHRPRPAGPASPGGAGPAGAARPEPHDPPVPPAPLPREDT